MNGLQILYVFEIGIRSISTLSLYGKYFAFTKYC